MVNADDTALALVRSRGLLDEHLHRLRELPAHVPRRAAGHGNDLVLRVKSDKPATRVRATLHH